MNKTFFEIGNESTTANKSEAVRGNIPFMVTIIGDTPFFSLCCNILNDTY